MMPEYSGLEFSHILTAPIYIHGSCIPVLYMSSVLLYILYYTVRRQILINLDAALQTLFRNTIAYLKFWRRMDLPEHFTYAVRIS